MVRVDNYIVFDAENEFERLRKARVGFNSPHLKQLSIDVIVRSTDLKSNNNKDDPYSGQNIKEHIKTLWISRFKASNNIVFSNRKADGFCKLKKCFYWQV